MIDGSRPTDPLIPAVGRPPGPPPSPVRPAAEPQRWSEPGSGTQPGSWTQPQQWSGSQPGSGPQRWSEPGSGTQPGYGPQPQQWSGPQPGSGPYRDPAPARRVRGPAPGILLGVPGLVLVIVGAFLPWLVSGSVRRSSFAVAGVADRLGVADGFAGALIAAWPALCAAVVLPVFVAAFGRWRPAGALAVLIGLGIGALAAGALWFGLRGASTVIRLEPTGPGIMLAGAILLVGGGVALLRTGRRS